MMYNQKRTTLPCPRQCGNRYNNTIQQSYMKSIIDGKHICAGCYGDELIQTTILRIKERASN